MERCRSIAPAGSLSALVGRGRQGWLARSEEHAVEEPGDFAVLSLEGMGVDPQRDRGISVPQPAGHRPHVGATGDGSGRSKVARLVDVGSEAQALGHSLAAGSEAVGQARC